MRTATEREALSILADILYPDEDLEAARQPDTRRSIQRAAARAGGMVLRHGYLCYPQPGVIQMRGRREVPSECLITMIR